MNPRAPTAAAALATAPAPVALRRRQNAERRSRPGCEPDWCGRGNRGIAGPPSPPRPGSAADGRHGVDWTTLQSGLADCRPSSPPHRDTGCGYRAWPARGPTLRPFFFFFFFFTKLTILRNRCDEGVFTDFRCTYASMFFRVVKVWRLMRGLSVSAITFYRQNFAFGACTYCSSIFLVNGLSKSYFDHIAQRLIRISNSARAPVWLVIMVSGIDCWLSIACLGGI